MNTDVKLVVRLSPEEKAVLAHQAEYMGITMSDLVRIILVPMSSATSPQDLMARNSEMLENYAMRLPNINAVQEVRGDG